MREQESVGMISKEEQALVDAFYDGNNFSRHIFDLKVLLNENQKLYSEEDVINIAHRIYWIQERHNQNQEEIIKLRKLFSGEP
jgi:hypothetical protein